MAAAARARAPACAVPRPRSCPFALPAFLVWAALAVLVAGTVAGCGGADEGRAASKTYVVKPGDTLYSIAWRHRLDYRDVARWNGIGSDYTIRVGQVLTLVPPRSRAVPAGAAGARSARTGEGTDSRAPADAARDGASGTVARPGAARPPAPGAALPRTVAWNWPAHGRVVGTVQRPNGGVGLRIDGADGQEIRAAAAGRVVYTGAGLRAYGQLVIVRHGEEYLSAYGHNRELYVREGQEVRAGQRLAAMGRGPGDVPMLYFEIRLNGRPVDPLKLLPQR